MSGRVTSDSQVYKLLNHPLRRRILSLIAERKIASASELAAELSKPLNTVGYHVRRLRDLGVLVVAKTAPGGGNTHLRIYYRLRRLDEGFRLESAPEIHPELRALWSELNGIAGISRFDIPAALLAERTITLDRAGRTRVSDAMQELARRTREIEVQAASRMRASEPASNVVEVAVVTLLFEAASRGARTERR